MYIVIWTNFLFLHLRMNLAVILWWIAKITLNLVVVSISTKSGVLSVMFLIQSFLKSLYRLHLKRKWHSSSTSLNSHKVQSLSCTGWFRNLPVSIFSGNIPNLNCAIADLSEGDIIWIVTNNFTIRIYRMFVWLTEVLSIAFLFCTSIVVLLTMKTC